MSFKGSAAFAAALALVCCALIPGSSSAQGKVDMWDGDMPIRPAWLKDRMPEDALAYARVPNLLGLFATPKGNAMDPALRSTANVENVLKLKKGLSDNVLQHIPMFHDPRARSMAEYVRSPIEVVAMASPAPSAIVSLNISLDSDQALYDMFDVFSMADPNFAMVSEMDDRRIGQLVTSGMPAVFTFNLDNGQLLVNGGPGANAENFLAMLDKMSSQNPNHAMVAMEQTIDESGQGLFFWFNVEAAMPMMQMFAPPEDMQELMDAGLDEVRTAAFGWGSANGKGRLSIAFDVMEGGDRELLPYVSNSLHAKSVGDPDALVLLSIPTSAEFSRIEARALQEAEAESRADWSESKKEFAELTNTTIDELLSAVGPEIMFIFDRAGDYAAVRVRDARLWDDIVARLAEKSGTAVEKRKISGETYYHWNLPGDLGWLDDDSIEELGWAGQLLKNQRDHWYWTTDGDYLYVAAVPQVLMDRKAYGAKTDVGRWLSESQRINGNDAVMSFVGTSRKLPKRFYAAYVEILQYLGDIAQADLDIWSMPTAKQLELPDKGTLGFTIRLGKPIVGVEMTFENNPLESMVAGGAGSVAMVGILSAIAIPAYKDYTVRAHVSEGLNLAAAQKAAITESYLENGRFPDANEADNLSVNSDAGKYVWSVVVIPDTGVIAISYDDETAPEGEQVFLEPVVTPEGSVIWSCSATFADKHLPAACRDGELPIYGSDEI